MSPVKPISNIRSIRATVLLICGALAAACDRAETRTAPVNSSPPSGSYSTPAAAAASRNDALVRVVHAVPLASAMDVYAGDLLAFDGVGFKAVTSYRALDGKRYVFSVRPAGMTNAKPLASNTEGLEDGRYYSVFALPGEGRSVRLRVVADHLDQPPGGKARLRIVHGGEGLDTADIRAAGAAGPLIEGVKFQSVTDYQEVNPFNGALEVQSGGATVLVLPSAHLEANRFYTMVIVSRNGSGREAFIIEDQLTPSTTAR